VQVNVMPVETLIDQPVSIVVTDAKAGSEVTLTMSTTDAAGHQWRSRGQYVIGGNGTLQLTDPDRPWWDMKFVGPAEMAVAFSLPDDSMDYAVEVANGSNTARTTAQRIWATGPRPERVEGAGWALQVYRPAGSPEPAPAVMLVPGTTGPGTLSAIAALLASHGYVAAVFLYLGEPGMLASFKEVPVENVHAGLAKLGDLPGVDSSRLALYAVSVGTIAAAYACSVRAAPQLRALVLVAPSNVVWQALGDGGSPPKASSITVAGQPVPHVRVAAEKLLGQLARNAVLGKLSRRPRSTALTLLPSYAAGLGKAKTAAAAEIPVENISCPILTIAGGSDAMWPAAEMAQALHRRRRQHATGGDDVELNYPGAGHFFRPPATPTTVNRNDSLVAGGTPAASAKAQRDAWTRTLAFLKASLG
jgi:dienelactone hydrolase